MNVMQRIRAYHMVQATLAVVSFVTGELGVIHAWLGYSVAVIIVFRLLWSLSGERQLGLARFHPVFEGLNASNFPVHPAIGKTLILGIALSLIGATVTGIVLDKGKALGIKTTSDIISVPILAGNDSNIDAKKGHKRERKREHKNRQEGFVDELHEFFANMMMFFVAMHITYMILLKWPIAKFMCSFQKMDQPEPGGTKRS